MGKSWGNHGKIFVNGSSHGKIMGKPRENLCKGRFSWENHGESWENLCKWKFSWDNPWKIHEHPRTRSGDIPKSDPISKSRLPKDLGFSRSSEG